MLGIFLKKFLPIGINPNLLLVTLSIPLTILVSTVSYHVIEVRLGRWLRNLTAKA